MPAGESTDRPPTDWSEFFLRHERSLTAYARALVRTEPDALDLLQSVLTTMIQRRVDPGVAPAYVMSALRRQAIDGHRRRTSVETVTLVEAAYEPVTDDAEDAEDRSAMLVAMAALPESEAEVVLLHTAGGLSLREIAAVLETPLGTVATLHRRAMARLRAAVGADTPGREVTHGGR